MENKKKNMTVRLTLEEFKAVKIRLIDKDMTFQKYMLELIRKDMKESDINE